MTKARTKQISLTRFATGTARLSPEYCTFVAAACALKLKQHGHPATASFVLKGAFNETVNFKWEEPDPRSADSFAEKATEFAGECVGILLCEKLTEFNVVERSWINSGFDFWLGLKKDPLFQHKARLEMSGIDNGSDAEIAARVRKKEAQVNAGSESSSGNALIVVSQFQRPVATVVRYA